jgi:hypothetical protein
MPLHGTGAAALTVTGASVQQRAASDVAIAIRWRWALETGAQLGPAMPNVSPRRTSSETWLTAVRCWRRTVPPRGAKLQPGSVPAEAASPGMMGRRWRPGHDRALQFADQVEDLPPEP